MASTKQELIYLMPHIRELLEAIGFVVVMPDNHLPDNVDWYELIFLYVTVEDYKRRPLEYNLHVSVGTINAKTYSIGEILEREFEVYDNFFGKDRGWVVGGIKKSNNGA